MTATASKRLPSDKALPGTASGQHAPSTAPAHRRIMQLRKQKSVPSETSDSPKDWSDQQPEELDLDSSEDPLADNQLVNVRFTFSRQRQRREGSKKNVYDAETMGLSGAFSPTIELEATLDAIAFRTLGEGENIVSNNDNQITDGLDRANDEDASTEDAQMAEINVVVFEVMQDSIDRVAEAFCLELMQEEASEFNTREQLNVYLQHLDSANEGNQVEDDESGDANGANEDVGATQAASDPADSSMEIPSRVEPNDTVESLPVKVDTQPTETEIISSPQEETAAQSLSRSEQAEEYEGDDFDDEPPALLNSSIDGLENNSNATEQPAAEQGGSEPETEMIHEPTEYDEEDYDDDDEEEEDDDGVSYSVDDFQ